MSKSFLLVDDDPDYLEILDKQLTRNGFMVVAVDDFSKAELAISSRSFSHAIVDLNLKNNSGLRLIPKIKEKNPEAKVVVLTGYASFNTSIDAIKLGASYYLAKPVGIQEILASFDKQPLTGLEAEGATQTKDIKHQEWETIHQVLKENNFNISKTAEALGMHRRTLQRKIKKKLP
ncbi:two-component system response regulator [Candidatus Marinamargulisbacteria bacterium SCGC AAA071-K20]|nr:two-component system response regulator [Candidatus Marinamargulisbacteria bacterium SCGC AAA071-K20]